MGKNWKPEEIIVFQIVEASFFILAILDVVYYVIKNKWYIYIFIGCLGFFTWSLTKDLSFISDKACEYSILIKKLPIFWRFVYYDVICATILATMTYWGASIWRFDRDRY